MRKVITGKSLHILLILTLVMGIMAAMSTTSLATNYGNKTTINGSQLERGDLLAEGARIYGDINEITIAPKWEISETGRQINHFIYSGNYYAISSDCRVCGVTTVTNAYGVTAVITLEEYSDPIEIKATSMKMNKESTVISIGETETLNLILTPEDATITDVVWESEDDEIARVDDEGNVTGIEDGETEITVTATNGTEDSFDDIEATCTVTVEQYKVTAESTEHGKITVQNTYADPGDEDSTYADPGDEIEIKVTPDKGYRLKAGSLRANDGNVGIIDNTFTMPEENVTVSCVFEPIKVTSIRFRNSRNTVPEGDSFKIEMSINPSEALDKSLSWESDNEWVEVSEDGVVTGKKEGEKAKITVTTKDGSDLSRSKLITVTHKHALKKTEAKPVTCEEPGNIEYWTCTKENCGKMFSDAQAKTEISNPFIPATGHNWDDVTYSWVWNDDNDAAKVKAVKSCLNDPSHDVSEEVDAAAVTEDPTCYKEGKTVYTAEFVNTDFETQTLSFPISKTEHDWGDWTTGEDGKQTRSCRNTGCSAIETRDDPDHVHTMKKHEEVPPQCEAQGKKEYYECTVCHKNYLDENGNQEITDMGSLGIPAVGHNFGTPEVTVLVKPTCTTTGTLRVHHPCTRCRGKDTYPSIDELGHRWAAPTYTWSDEGKNVTATRECICLNDAEHKDAETVEAVLTTLIKPATCEEEGEAVYKALFPIEGSEPESVETTMSVTPLGHSWDKGEVTKAPGCTEAGEKTFSCTREGCSGTKKEEVAPLGHDWVEDTGAAKDPGCTEKGQKTYGCSRCDETKTVDVPALGHKWEKEAVTAEPTCTGKGEMTYKCSGCDQTKTEELAPLGHDWDEGKVTKEATTSQDGVKIYTCKTCEATMTEIIPMLEHKGKDGTAVGPGASFTVAERAILGMKSDKDPAGARVVPLEVKSTKQTKTSVTVSWTKARGATRYVIYGNKSGKSSKMQLLARVTGKSVNFTEIAGKAVMRGTSYKFIVVAIDDTNQVVSTSKVIHVASAGGKIGNYKKVTVRKSVVKKAKKLKKGKSLKLKAKAIAKSKKLKVKTYVAIRYESTNTKIATVNSKGVVKARKKGKCYVYAYAQNGVSKKIKVVVK